MDTVYGFLRWYWHFLKFGFLDNAYQKTIIYTVFSCGQIIEITSGHENQTSVSPGGGLLVRLKPWRGPGPCGQIRVDKIKKTWDQDHEKFILHSSESISDTSNIQTSWRQRVLLPIFQWKLLQVVGKIILLGPEEGKAITSPLDSYHLFNLQTEAIKAS